MAKSLLLEIVTPDRLVLRLDVASVTGAGTAGAFTALPLHIPFLTSLTVGYLSYRVAGVVNSVFVSGGFADVTFDKVLVLAEAAELPEEIDVDRARKARERAAARLAVEQREDIDYARAKSALQRAILRIRLHELGKSGLGPRTGA
ncbi:ATP synthase F1, epsilon subunit [Solidesulfovibrio fructosivorans JJ]]|uniref:ATP synthase epsilon chain n=1 Tax=Solidesulfovibrio fructosivorans JJ] TaxID=596151 RepID=E1JRV0_SOLFR|nr:F0F1 ATP synthase subunit epsilon [Solidesulfovibrio fructosivorans]EFL52719.1 ATP synthase F1, epsilon subunit [Solidesulfovibrio fructosivorans JJ]]